MGSADNNIAETSCLEEKRTKIRRNVTETAKTQHSPEYTRLLLQFFT